MAWIALIFAGTCEIFGVAMLNQFSRESKLQTLVLIFISFGCSFFLLSYAMRVLPMGISYATWTGIGASGGAFIGMYIYKEPKNLQRVSFIGLIIISVIGINLTYK